MDHRLRSALERVAQEHLPPDVAEQWLALLRPAVALTAAEDEQPVVARFGGDPVLPADAEWPTWPGHGPLSFVGEVDLAALSSLGLDVSVPLPAHGRLLAFYFDGSYDDFEGLIGPWDPSSQAGARLLHLPDADGSCRPRQAPERVESWPERMFTAQQTVTAPPVDHPVVSRTFRGPDQDDDAWALHPVQAEAFWESLDEVGHGSGEEPHHQLGGWALPVQGPVELEVAEVSAPEADQEDEARRWTLLLQVDSEEGAQWGDWGALYWLARHDDLTAGDLSRTCFTWQCA